MNVRGRGTLVAWDHHTMAQRDGIVQSKQLNLFSSVFTSTVSFKPIFNTIFSAAMEKGLLLGGCGTHSIRLRPSLVFERRHADEFLDLFEDSLRTL